MPMQRSLSEMGYVPDIKDHEAYPAKYKVIFEQLWADSDVQKTFLLGGLPDRYVFCSVSENILLLTIRFSLP